MSESWPAPLETFTIRGCGAALEQRQERLDQPPRPEGVDLQDLVCPVEVVVGRPDRIAVDAGVVDQRVEVARIGADPLLSRIDLVLIGDVELDGDDPLSLLDVVGIPGAGEHDEAVVGGELARDLGADPPTCPADQGHRRQILLRSSSFLPITIRWISEVPSPISSSGASR